MKPLWRELLIPVTLMVVVIFSVTYSCSRYAESEKEKFMEDCRFYGKTDCEWEWTKIKASKHW